MSAFESAMAQMLLFFIPNILVWAFILLVLIGFLMAKFKNPASVSGHLGFILIYTINTYLGGVFLVINLVMFAAIAVLLVLGYLKLITR